MFPSACCPHAACPRTTHRWAVCLNYNLDIQKIYKIPVLLLFILKVEGLLICIVMMALQLGRLYSRHVFRRLCLATQDSLSRPTREHRCQSCLLLDSTALHHRNVTTSSTSFIFQKTPKPEVKGQPTYVM